MKIFRILFKSSPHLRFPSLAVLIFAHLLLNLPNTNCYIQSFSSLSSSLEFFPFFSYSYHATYEYRKEGELTSLYLYLSIFISLYLYISLSVYLSICISLSIYLSISISLYLLYFSLTPKTYHVHFQNLHNFLI